MVGEGVRDFGRIVAARLRGHEPVHMDGHPLGPRLLDFWQWSCSDIVSNATRGVLAEFLVASALDAATGVRDEWAPFDLTTPEGVKVEVKSSAFVQAWSQKRLSKVSFACARKTAFDPLTNQASGPPRRHADVYVFALLQHTDQATIDPLNVAQWVFYVVPSVMLDDRKRSQHSITLPSLRRLVGEPVGFDDLAKAVAGAMKSQAGGESR